MFDYLYSWYIYFYDWLVWFYECARLLLGSRVTGGVWFYVVKMLYSIADFIIYFIPLGILFCIVYVLIDGPVMWNKWYEYLIWRYEYVNKKMSVRWNKKIMFYLFFVLLMIVI